MALTVRQVMNPDIVVCDAATSIIDVAGLMHDRDVGDVLVTDDNRLIGIVTDRDIVVRCIAQAIGPIGTVTAADVASREVATVQPDTDAEQAVRIMRAASIRRLPVVENDTPIGVVSIGDVAIETDPDSALADISSATPNN
jgi:CBS domain-containing protein